MSLTEERRVSFHNGLLSHKIHCTLKCVQVVKKGSDLVTPLLKTFQELIHRLRQPFSTRATYWKYLGKFQKCNVLAPTQSN